MATSSIDLRRLNDAVTSGAGYAVGFGPEYVSELASFDTVGFDINGDGLPEGDGILTRDEYIAARSKITNIPEEIAAYDFDYVANKINTTCTKLEEALDNPVVTGLQPGLLLYCEPEKAKEMAKRLITAEKVGAEGNLRMLLHSLPPPDRADLLIWLAQSEYAKKCLNPNNVYATMTELPLDRSRAAFIKTLLLNDSLSYFRIHILHHLNNILSDDLEKSKILKDMLSKGDENSIPFKQELLFQVAQLPESCWPEFRDQIKYDGEITVTSRPISDNEWHSFLKFRLTHPDPRFSRDAANRLSAVNDNAEDKIIFKSLFSIALKSSDKETKLNAAGSFARVSAWLFDDDAEKNKYFQMILDSGLTTEECLNYLKFKGITQSCDDFTCRPLSLIAQLEEKIKKDKEAAEEKAGSRGCSLSEF
ncbi:MAG: hypothetical protein HYY43_06795 [Deltaproteobacteria bacterium]|nr:hypothetical protein [Deltaproteobacteria bacterium]MBI2975278.1 hypothetical protein [Deltaproteobacteria bacterium]